MMLTMFKSLLRRISTFFSNRGDRFYPIIVATLAVVLFVLLISFKLHVFHKLHPAAPLWYFFFTNVN